MNKLVKCFVLEHTRHFHKTQGPQDTFPQDTVSENNNALKLQKDFLLYFPLPCRTPVSILVEMSS